MSAYLYVSPGLHLCVHYKCAREKLLRKALVTEEVDAPPTSDFGGYAHVQLAGSKLRGEHCFRYQSHAIPGNHDPPDTVAFVYRDSICPGLEKVAVSLDRDLDQQKEDLDGGVVMGSGSITRPDS